MVASGDQYVCENYRGKSEGRCLILGHHKTVWDEAEAALQGGPVGAVIASPEAAEQWPGPIEAIAQNDAHALRIARMLGYEDFVFCGKQPERKAA
jgi:hypothetical protein